MMGEILMGIMGTAFLVGAFMQFRCTGPVWSAEYISASARDRKKMQTKQEYYWSALGCLYIGVLFLLSLIYSLTQLKVFLYVIFVFSAFLFLHIIYGIYRAIIKSTRRK